MKKADFIELANLVRQSVMSSRNIQAQQTSSSSPTMSSIFNSSSNGATPHQGPSISLPEITAAALRLPKDEVMLIAAMREQEWLSMLVNVVDSSSTADKYKILVYLKARITYLNAREVAGHDTALKMFDACGANMIVAMGLDPEAQSRLNRLMGIPQSMHQQAYPNPSLAPCNMQYGSTQQSPQPRTMPQQSFMSPQGYQNLTPPTPQFTSYAFGSQQQAQSQDQSGWQPNGNTCYACHQRGHKVPECQDKEAVARYNAKKASTAAARSPQYPPYSTFYPVNNNTSSVGPAPNNAGNASV